MQAVKAINDGIAFALEIVMLIALSFSGYHMGPTAAIKWLFAILLPAVVIVIWSLWAAPRASYRLHQPWLLGLELGLMLLAAALLYAAGRKEKAIIFAVVAVVSQFAAYILKQS